MNKSLLIGATIIVVAALLGVVIFFALNNYIYQEKQGDGEGQQANLTEEPTQVVVVTPSEIVGTTDEDAETVGFQFIRDFIETGPPNPDPIAAQAVYNVLSENAKQSVSEDTITRDLAGFVGVQDLPDQGVSVEDLQREGETATLIVGLNYSGGRVLKAINMVVENNMWKVDSVETLEE